MYIPSFVAQYVFPRWLRTKANKTPLFVWLVVSTPLKNMKVSWGYPSQYMEK